MPCGRKKKKVLQSVRGKRLQSALDSVEEQFDVVSTDAEAVTKINWQELPRSLDPFFKESTKLSEARATRKRQQIESVVHYAMSIVEEGDTVCDFGAGSGHLALLIAYLRPSCRVVVVEHNPEKHEMILSRLQHLNNEGIRCNIDIYNTIDDFEKSGRPLDLGVSLHSCGLLTDETLHYCVSKQAKYVLVPCCYGQITSVYPHTKRCTSSKSFQNVDSDFMKLIQSSADYTVPASDELFHESEAFYIAKRCMIAVDSDRQAWARTRGFSVSIKSLFPLHCSPKNNIIIGQPLRNDEYPFTEKVENILSRFENYLGDLESEVALYPSPTPHYRLRCRFGVTTKNDGDMPFDYFVFENGAKVVIESFPIASTGIQKLMETLRMCILSYPVLLEGLEAIHFLDTLAGNKLITMIYSTALVENAWEESARKLQVELQNTSCSVGLIGRSKKQKIALSGIDYVVEKLKIRSGKELIYRQYEGSFSNPNGRINERCLDWLMDKSLRIVSELKREGEQLNLLELYCGCGNHTMALGQLFDNVTAVELDSKLCDAAKYNAKLNDLENQVKVIRLHSEKFCKSLLKKRTYKEKTFQVILVDPPRAGLDNETLNNVTHFERVIYISCNPSSFLRDYESALRKTHTIVHFAVFDQFENTPHCEIAMEMRKRVEQ